MGVIKNLIFRWKKAVAPVVKYLTLSTTSTLTDWTITQITHTGSTLTWDVTGDITPTSQTANKPTFNLSANTGTVNMNIYDVSPTKLFYAIGKQITAIDVTQAIALTNLILGTNQITVLDLTQNVNLTYLDVGTNPGLSALDITLSPNLNVFYCNSCNLTSLDMTNKTNLQFFDCKANNVPSLDLTNKPSLDRVYVQQNNMSPASTDQIYIDLGAQAKEFGELHIRNNRTAASDSARTALLGRSWLIFTYAT